MFKSAFVLLLLIVSTPFSAQGNTGLQTSLSGDMVYSQGLNDRSGADEKLIMRGVEMKFYAPIDHLFNGDISAAAHEENGKTNFELHELFVGSDKLIPRSRFRIGQFFLGIGRLNRIHQHDWPFIYAPKVHETFFASEGVFDAGIEMEHLLPTSFYGKITWGVTSGYRYGHSHTAGNKPRVPTHYMRFETFKNFSNTSGLMTAFNYLGRTDRWGNQTQLPGIEMVAKWRAGKTILYMLQSELWYRLSRQSNNVKHDEVGMYLLNQFSLKQDLSLGFRLDIFKDLSKSYALTDKKINNIEYGIVPELTWKPSEFSTWRLGLSHAFTREEGNTTKLDTRLNLQWVFILGSHPAHDF